LSATEIVNPEEGIEDREGLPLHRRTGSGRSSAGSGRFPSGYQRPQQGRFSGSSGNTPPNLEAGEERNDIEPPVSIVIGNGDDEKKVPYGTNGSMDNVGTFSTDLKDRSPSSHSDESEREDSFGRITELTAPSGALVAAQKAKAAEELRRRGSVDDRTTAMRLFVANPDLDD
jgi:hypothetical protein